ncbi:MAG: ATPase, T2SS/T4P/T4SS family [Sulfolobales archaeon]
MARTAFEEIYVADLSALMEEGVSRLVEEGRIGGKIHVIIPVVEELARLAREGSTIASAGLDEISRLRRLSDQGAIELAIIDYPRARFDQTVDQVVRRYAYEVGGKIITADPIQASASRAMGVDVIEVSKKHSGLSIEAFFDGDTMSVHLKEGAPPRAKKGSPGNWYFVRLREEPMTREEVERIAREILEMAQSPRDGGFVESERRGSTIVQLGDYRVVIVRPPLGDGYEITVTRPIARPRLEDYRLPEKLLRRLTERAEGILIAGSPGMGKTTFAQALAEYYMRMGRVVKTIESPRDMRLPREASQYSKVYASAEELHDILLLSRPDYTFFDEMRDDPDFNLYIDLRLAGIGMVGVVHAASPIDAVQRLLRRVDLGMIPSIVDTVIYINRGNVEKVYEVGMTVKLPTGLREAELARPVVEVRDFLSGELEYEIYTFGEQTIVVPVKRLRPSARGHAGSVEARILGEVERLLPGAGVSLEGDTLWVSVSRDNVVDIGKKFVKVKRKIEKQYGVNVKLRIEE